MNQANTGGPWATNLQPTLTLQQIKKKHIGLRIQNNNDDIKVYRVSVKPVSLL